MMILLRIFPKQDLSDSWSRTLTNSKKLSNKDCTPLYASQQEEKDFMSIMYDVRDIDSFADILVRDVPSATNSKKTRTITLLKPVFFPAPKDRPKQLERYQVAIRAASDQLNNVFNHTVHLAYPVDFFPTYIAYSFGEDDILMSTLSVSREKVSASVKEKIESQDGVLGVDVARIDKSERLAPLEMWRRYRKDKYLFTPSDRFDEYDFTEQALLSGALAKEIE